MFNLIIAARWLIIGRFNCFQPNFGRKQLKLYLLFILLHSSSSAKWIVRFEIGPFRTDFGPKMPRLVEFLRSPPNSKYRIHRAIEKQRTRALLDKISVRRFWELAQNREQITRFNLLVEFDAAALFSRHLSLLNKVQAEDWAVEGWILDSASWNPVSNNRTPDGEILLTKSALKSKADRLINFD